MVSEGITPDEAKRFYDRFGAKQDLQSWYEDPPTAKLIEQISLMAPNSIFELGCGTGRVAEKLLGNHDCRYLGVDVSETMITLAKDRLRRFANSNLSRVDGTSALPADSHSFDLVFSTYVFDLMKRADIHNHLAEVWRILKPGGVFANIALTYGTGKISKLLSAAWEKIQGINPKAVGGCRPLKMVEILRDQQPHLFAIDTVDVICRFGICSELVTAKKIQSI
jgi:ubiquinone/menaquinone biosynthesis C-methylase UbiE